MGYINFLWVFHESKSHVNNSYRDFPHLYFIKRNSSTGFSYLIENEASARSTTFYYLHYKQCECSNNLIQGVESDNKFSSLKRAWTQDGPNHQDRLFDIPTQQPKKKPLTICAIYYSLSFNLFLYTIPSNRTLWKSFWAH